MPSDKTLSQLPRRTAPLGTDLLYLVADDGRDYATTVDQLLGVVDSGVDSGGGGLEVSKTVFMDVAGVDLTGTIGEATLPFLTLSAGTAAAVAALPTPTNPITIQLAAGVYTQATNVTTTDGNLTISGAGPFATQINFTETAQFIRGGDNITLRNLTLQRSGDNVSAVLTDDVTGVVDYLEGLLLDNVRVINGSGIAGGLITGEVKDCTFRGATEGINYAYGSEFTGGKIQGGPMDEDTLAGSMTYGVRIAQSAQAVGPAERPRFCRFIGCEIKNTDPKGRALRGYVESHVVENIEVSGAVSVDVGTNIWTLASHGMVTCQRVWIRNTGGALPAGVAATFYYVRVESANTFTLYDTSAHSETGGANGKLLVSTAGTGTQSISSASNESVNWAAPEVIGGTINGPIGATRDLNPTGCCVMGCVHLVDVNIKGNNCFDYWFASSAAGGRWVDNWGTLGALGSHWFMKNIVDCGVTGGHWIPHHGPLVPDQFLNMGFITINGVTIEGDGVGGFRGHHYYTLNCLSQQDALATGNGLIGWQRRDLALLFTGLDTSERQFAEVPATDAFSVNNLTVECWIKFDPAVTGEQGILSHQNAAGTGWSLQANATNGVVYVYNTAATIAESQSVVFNGSWHHLAFTIVDTAVKIWIDGVEVAVTGGVGLMPPTEIEDRTNRLMIGAYDTDAGVNNQAGTSLKAALRGVRISKSPAGAVYASTFVPSERLMATASTLAFYDEDTNTPLIWSDKTGRFDATLRSTTGYEYARWMYKARAAVDTL